MEFILDEPLRGLTNGVKDRIIKRNGQWVVERNCGEILLDATEKWNLYYGENELEDYPVFYTPIDNMALNHSILCDKIPVLKAVGGDTGKFAVGSHNTVNSIRVCIELSKLSSRSVSSFKEWLQTNPIKVVYQLNTPIYQPLKVDSMLDIYLDTTYISNDSIVPANIKVTIDRTVNITTEAIELAKTNPTLENISQARYWTNLLKNSLNKDSLQSEIDNITKIEDLTIEPKKVSSSLDVYVKSKNSLTMTLSTNSIIFDGFTGVDDMEKLNAVNITINSSLSYRINSYLMSEIKNKDNTKSIPKELLNIRLNGEEDYKAFNGIDEKLVLKDDCQKGNNNNFNIDLILKGSLTNKADIYKTVIKLEAEQK